MEKYIDCSKKLGKGNFSSVKLVQRKSDNKLVAMKMIDMDINTGDIPEAINNETSILEKLHHPNIVEFYESFVDEDHLCLIMEYCDQGDLQQRIKETKKKGEYFPENLILEWFIQLCLAVKYLHDARIIHRDIKVHNAFLTSEGIVKLGDFGISKQLDKTGDLASTQTGTPFYLTPEMCSHSTSSHKSDIWMLGCILHELCSLEKPFSGDNIPNVIHKIMQEKYAPIPEHYSSLIHKLVQVLLEKDHNKRPSIEDILLIPEIIEEVKKFKLKHPNVYPSSCFIFKDGKDDPNGIYKVENGKNLTPENEKSQINVFSMSLNQGSNQENISKGIEIPLKLETPVYKPTIQSKIDEEGKINHSRNLEINSKLSPVSSIQSPNQSTKRKANNIRALIEQKRANVPSQISDKNQTPKIIAKPEISIQNKESEHTTEINKTETNIKTHNKGNIVSSDKVEKAIIRPSKNEPVKTSYMSTKLNESSRKNQNLVINIPEISDGISQPSSKDDKSKSSTVRSNLFSTQSQQNPSKPKKKASFSDQVFDPLSPGSPNRPFFTIQFLKMQLGEEKYEKIWDLIEKHEDPKKLLNEESQLIMDIIGEENKHLRKMIDYLIFKKNDINSGQSSRIIFTPSQVFKSPASASSIFKHSFLTEASIDVGKDEISSTRRNPWHLSKQRIKTETTQNILEDEVIETINDNTKDKL